MLCRCIVLFFVFLGIQAQTPCKSEVITQVMVFDDRAFDDTCATELDMSKQNPVKTYVLSPKNTYSCSSERGNSWKLFSNDCPETNLGRSSAKRQCAGSANPRAMDNKTRTGADYLSTPILERRNALAQSAEIVFRPRARQQSQLSYSTCGQVVAAEGLPFRRELLMASEFDYDQYLSISLSLSIYIYIYIYIYMHTCVCVYIYIYIYKH